MDGLQELTNALSNGTTHNPLRRPLPQDWRFAAPHPKLQLLLSQASETGKATDFKFGWYTLTLNDVSRAEFELVEGC